LSRFEIQEILARLDRAESFCPSAEASDRLWKIKDEFHALFLKASGNDSAGWLAWGQDYCRRADRQASDRLWEQLQAEAAKKLAKAAELSPDKAEAFYQWGRVLEFNSYLVSPFLSQISPASQAGRLRKTLTEARNQYEKAYSQENRLQYLDSLARVSLNLAKQEKKLEDFKAALAKAVSLGHQAVRGAGSSPRAWLAWGRLCLDSPASLPAAFRPYLTAEGFSAYNRWLLSNPVRASELIELADEVWTLASQHPGDRDQALSMLIDICRRLVRLAPQEPGYGFALGLTVLAQLSSRPAWPDDPAVTNDLSAKRAFLEVLKAYQGSLEGLSLSPGPAPGLPAAAPLRFLAPEVGIGPFSALASYPERLALAFNRPAGRLLAMARPETLPPWYQYQLASFLRLAAASGYLPEEEQMAYWRLALHYLRLAKKSPDTSCLAAVLAEEGLVLAELNLLNSAPDPSLLYQAENLWQEAEKLAPDSSRYARARWAAWQGERAALEDSLRHPAALEDSLVWPAFEQGSLDPAFRPMHREAWFKKAWFGYSR
jgi:hypothetical protein